MEISEIEAKLPNSFVSLQQVIAKILKENDVLPNEEESKAEQL
jgi:hypothetical protein